MSRSSRPVQPDNNGTTDEASVATSRPLILGVVAHVLKAALGILFLYLGTTKLLGRDEAARLAAMGVGRTLRDTIGWLELAVTGLLFARVSGYLLHPLIAGVALIEVGLLHRPPLAAVGCLAAHGLSTWARSAHDRRRVARAQVGRPLAMPFGGVAGSADVARLRDSRIRRTIRWLGSHDDSHDGGDPTSDAGPGRTDSASPD